MSPWLTINKRKYYQSLINKIFTILLLTKLKSAKRKKRTADLYTEKNWNVKVETISEGDIEIALHRQDGRPSQGI